MSKSNYDKEKFQKFVETGFKNAQNYLSNSKQLENMQYINSFKNNFKDSIAKIVNKETKTVTVNNFRDIITDTSRHVIETSNNTSTEKIKKIDELLVTFDKIQKKLKQLLEKPNGVDQQQLPKVKEMIQALNDGISNMNVEKTLLTQELEQEKIVNTFENQQKNYSKMQQIYTNNNQLDDRSTKQLEQELEQLEQENSGIADQNSQLSDQSLNKEEFFSTGENIEDSLSIYKSAKDQSEINNSVFQEENPLQRTNANTAESQNKPGFFRGLYRRVFGQPSSPQKNNNQVNGENIQNKQSIQIEGNTNFPIIDSFQDNNDKSSDTSGQKIRNKYVSNALRQNKQEPINKTKINVIPDYFQDPDYKQKINNLDPQPDLADALKNINNNYYASNTTSLATQQELKSILKNNNKNNYSEQQSKKVTFEADPRPVITSQNKNYTPIETIKTYTPVQNTVQNDQLQTDKKPDNNSDWNNIYNAYRQYIENKKDDEAYKEIKNNYYSDNGDIKENDHTQTLEQRDQLRFPNSEETENFFTTQANSEQVADKKFFMEQLDANNKPTGNYMFSCGDGNLYKGTLQEIKEKLNAELVNGQSDSLNQSPENDETKKLISEGLNKVTAYETKQQKITQQPKPLLPLNSMGSVENKEDKSPNMQQNSQQHLKDRLNNQKHQNDNPSTGIQKEVNKELIIPGERFRH